jgi:hypothetical protein
MNLEKSGAASIVETVNRFVEETGKRKGEEPIDILMALAQFAGLETFNPYRASDYELREIADAIPLYLEECK